jgi:cytochrome P450
MRFYHLSYLYSPRTGKLALLFRSTSFAQSFLLSTLWLVSMVVAFILGEVLSGILHFMSAQSMPGKLNRPPGPPRHPISGNLREIRRDALDFLLTSASEYGDIVSFHFMFFPGLLLNHPDFIRHVLQDNHRAYSKQHFDYAVLKPVLGEGLLTSDGDFWLRQRRLIQPAFHRQRVAAFGNQMVQDTREMLQRWEPVCKSGQALDVAEEMMRLTLTIVGRSLFSVDLSDQAGAIGPAFSYINAEVAQLFRSFLPTPLKFRLPRFQRALGELNRTVQTIIDKRRARLARSGDAGDDLLAMLIQARDEESNQQMSDKQLRNEVITLLLAGHETTANALTWTWYLLSQHPWAAERLRQELSTVLDGRPPGMDDLPALAYTRMVVQEALRLYPPAWIISRKAEQDDEIGGYPIPAGTVVSLSPYVMHRHPGFWQSPEVFDPERFSPSQTESRPAYAYFPFGGGPRLCIGRDFAMQEALLILATVAQRFELHLLPGHPVEMEALITLRPKYGMKMTLLEGAPRRKI